MSDKSSKAKVENKVLSFAEIIESDDIDVEPVFIAAWGGSVMVKVFTKAEAQEIRRKMGEVSEINGGKIDGDAFERLVIQTGLAEPKISDEQYTLLLGKSNSAVEELVKAITKINKMDGDSEEKEEKTFRD